MNSIYRGLFWLAAILAAVGVLLYLFVFDTFVVPAGDPGFAMSIEPTLRAGDRVLTRRGVIPGRGDLVRCTSSLQGGEVIGRIAGLGGDTVEIRGENVVLNGKPQPTRHACPKVSVVHPVSQQPVELDCAVFDDGPWPYQVLLDRHFSEDRSASRVEPGHAYLISDNRHLHQDTRDFGLVEDGTCQHIVFRLWGETWADASRRFTVLW